MAFPVVPVVLAGAAGLGAYLFFFKKSPGVPGSTAPGSTPGSPGTPGRPATPGAVPGVPTVAPSADMPADIRAAYQELLARGVDPAAMEIAADAMEQAGFKGEATQLRARAAQLRAQKRPAPVSAPSPQAPTPAPAPYPEAPAAPPPVQPAALPVFPYQPDLSPMPVGQSSASYYYDPSNGKRAKVNVREDARALRFLGYAAPIDPGGGAGLAADRGSGQGSFNSQMQDAVKHFQSDNGLTSDGWLGPQTLGKLGALVTAKNSSAAATNASRGVADATFSGTNRLLFGKAVTPPIERSIRVCSSGGMRLRTQPQRGAGGTTWVPAGGVVTILQFLPGEKSDPVAPGPGGWTLVKYGAAKGWLPSEWLC